MKQAIYGLILFLFLIAPPVADLAESIMSIHMHMQMPLLAVAGMLMTPFLQQKFKGFFNKWNKTGIPGILLFLIVVCYWLIPRAMDDTLTLTFVQIFKFISWPFLIGVPLRDSWSKLSNAVKNTVYIFLSVVYLFMAWLYIFSPDQLCNNYLIVEQRTLGWGFLVIALCILLFFIQTLFINDEDYE